MITEMTDVLRRVLNIADRVGNMGTDHVVFIAAMGALLIFGILNCVLGYRLLRFWMMLGGFFLGAGVGFMGVYGIGEQNRYTYLGVMLGAGVIFAVIAFFIYRAGVFMLGAGIGWTLSIYFIHPTTSAVFFGCILLGVALGALAVRYCREVLIVATSLIGGVFAGYALAKLGGLAEFPYGLGMSLGFAALGTLIQFAINKVEDEESEYEDSEEYEDYDLKGRKSYVNTSETKEDECNEGNQE